MLVSSGSNKKPPFGGFLSFMTNTTVKTTNAGRNPRANFQHFDSFEYEIIKSLSKSFYITNGGGIININISKYKYCLLKLTSDQTKVFGDLNEIIVLFSPFENFEPRTLDAIDVIHKRFSEFRLDKICTIVLSKDPLFEGKLQSLFKINQESRVVIPFSYNEINASTPKEFFTSRITKYYFSRDLFDFESPLRQDFYFFGRDGLSHSLIDRHLRKENSGIFGLRKSGKTSALFSVLRNAKQKEIPSSIIDCQTLHLNSWNKALYYVAQKINESAKSSISIEQKNYSTENAHIQFEVDITKIKNKNNKPVLLIFDEIEHITPKISASENWREGKDFLIFWQVVRSTFQKEDSPLTFIIAGTNPTCIEKQFINKTDNPIYNQFKPIYISGFDIDDTKNMVSTLGRYMGMRFRDEIYTYLTADYGGHPFLIRQICSAIYQAKKDLPQEFDIDRLFYEQCKDNFNSNSGDKYCEMIIGVLKEHYVDEHTMLTYLASGKQNEFAELAESDSSYVHHLIGYGIVEKLPLGYSFKIDTLKKYLENKNKYTTLNQNNSERLAEISKRRNDAEIQLRKIVRTQLLSHLTEQEARREVTKGYDVSQKKKSDSLSYKELFNPNKNNIYFSDLFNLMRKFWPQCFINIYNEDVEKFSARMTIINSIGRSDAHAKNVSDADMQSFRGAISWLEEKNNNFLED